MNILAQAKMFINVVSTSALVHVLNLLANEALVITVCTNKAAFQYHLFNFVF